MKILSILCLLVISSCALYNEIMTPARVKSAEIEAVKPAPVATVPFENMISKNWEYSDPGGAYTALTKSLNKKATLMIVKTDVDKLGVAIEVPGSKMSYRDGHSVEIKIDGVKTIHQVESSPNKVSASVRFADAKKLMGKLKNKKSLRVELLMNDEGLMYFDFDISELQEFFFI